MISTSSETYRPTSWSATANTITIEVIGLRPGTDARRVLEGKDYQMSAQIRHPSTSAGALNLVAVDVLDPRDQTDGYGQLLLRMIVHQQQFLHVAGQFFDILLDPGTGILPKSCNSWIASKCARF